MMAEIMDLVNYAVEHEEQVGKLLKAANVVADLLNHRKKPDDADVIRLLDALAPFLNKPTKGND